MNRYGVVLIGRNEGERLCRALDAAVRQAEIVVYVDSGSTDDSVAQAQQRGASVVELDMSIPFSAARARNQGRERLKSLAPDLEFMQVIDGDCELQTGWLERAEAALLSNTKLAAVCGRRKERHPEASRYNRLIDMEWDTPVGPAKSCGGDAMYRLEAFDAVGGFDPTVVAGEEPELCRRLRAEGWSIERLDAPMTMHDADLHSLSQWWRRDIRTGYGGLDVYRRTRKDDPLFAKVVSSARVWTLGWLAVWLISCGLAVWQPMLIVVPLMVCLAWLVQAARIGRMYRRRGAGVGDAVFIGLAGMVGKWAQLIGQARLMRDVLIKRERNIIEYKSAG